jgi:RNA polymerase sigma-70 factor (ECF subfamily)
MALAEHVRAALGSLTDDERQAIELAYFGGRTYKEVAAELGQAEGTVKSRIRSGLRRMRTELVDGGITVGGDG